MKKYVLAMAAFALTLTVAFGAPRGFAKASKDKFPPNFDPMVNTKKETVNYVNFKKDKDTGEIKTEYLIDRVMTPEEIEKTAVACENIKFPKNMKKVRHFLVWDRTEGFRHRDGIPALRVLLEELQKRSNGKWVMHFTDDRKEFETLESLKKYDCVIINNCTGRFFESYRGEREGFPGDEFRAKSEGMSGAEKQADAKMNYVCRDNLIKFVEEGGGIMGAHAACDAMDCKDRDNPDEKFPAYPVMMGGRFAGHPWGAGNKEESFFVEDPMNPVVKGLWGGSKTFKLQDEIYTFREEYGYSRDLQRVIISLDYDNSPKDGGEDPMKHTSRKTKDFGLVWVKEYGKGRVFYGAFGHRQDVYYRNPDVCEMYMRGLLFASGDLKLKGKSKRDDFLSPLGVDKNPLKDK